MARAAEKVGYECSQCGYAPARWLGQCPRCESWNTMREVAQQTAPGKRAGWTGKSGKPRTVAFELATMPIIEEARLRTGIGELDRVFGGGLVPGSSALLAGDPGVGKSTLLLEAAAGIAASGGRVLYATGEESLEQVRLRAARLGLSGEGLYLLASGDVGEICAHMTDLSPALVIIDSIQTAVLADSGSAAGSVTQVRECAAFLAGHARSVGTALVIAGHVTREGGIAGPRVLEHAVDVVLHMTSESGGPTRLIHAVKNRYGATDEVGVFEMRQEGLREVADPSRSFLAHRKECVPGSAVAAIIEGTRPLAVEVQALATPSVLSSPRRVATGIDLARVHVITAVIAKRLKLPISTHDLVVNVAGGLRVREPAVDLAVGLAIVSSLLDRPLLPGVAAAGEIGLSGELRGVAQAGRRVSEAERLGFDTCLIPNTAADLGAGTGTAVHVDTLADAVRRSLVGQQSTSDSSGD